MSNIDKRALREAAEKATPGNWWIDSHGQAMVSFIENDVLEVFATDNKRAAVRHEDTGNLSRWRNDNDATFIATADPATVLALLDELEAKDSTIATQQQEIRTLLNALGQSSEKRNSDLPDQKRIIGWRASDYTDETSDPELAKNWAAAIGVLPIFEGDVNTKLSAAAAGKGE
ncbi:TPA: ead/Ea22-like family protein [Enterobacter hormaechei subsp. xiangfangensis]|nr:ead/Ea22-like family protein [Enterobacter hormaechei subsp. xiangfangensis]